LPDAIAVDVDAGLPVAGLKTQQDAIVASLAGNLKRTPIRQSLLRPQHVHIRYFITSLDPGSVTAADLLELVRGHWKVENSLHFLKDRWWDEDRHHTRRPGLSAVMTSLNSIAVSIHRLRSDPSQPIRASADRINWKPARGLKMLIS